jgi:lysosomal alpha-mannosidase
MNNYSIHFLFALILLLVLTVATRAQEEQENNDFLRYGGNENPVSCTTLYNSNDELNVHVVAQSHCDPGWLMTVDEYYYNRVKAILDTVTDNLIQYPERKFVWAEVSFFSKWWAQQTPLKQAQFRQLLTNKQWEWMIGGWVMSDNAVTTYSANIDQMTHGHRFLKETFGELGIPRIGWDIDPFGISKNIARMYKEMGFEYHVIARIDWIAKANMKNAKKMEFKWKVDTNGSEILTHVIWDSYCTPSSLDFEGVYPWGYNNKTNPPPITPQNVEHYSELLVNITRSRASAYRTNHYMFPFGCDFEYASTVNWGNMSILMDYINEHKDKYGINIKYSLVSEYFDAVKQASSNFASFPSYDYDFLPYADNTKSFWTGYFTSRPNLKLAARVGERLGRSAELLFTFAQAQARSRDTFKQDFDSLYEMRSANGYIQHHDAITGTEREHVIQMYLSYITNGTEKIARVTNNALSQLIAKKNFVLLSFNQTSKLNRTNIFEPTPLILFNSLGWKRSSLVRLQVDDKNIEIVDRNGNKVYVEVLQKDSYFEVIFESGPVPALGFVTFFVQAVKERSVVQRQTITTNQPLTISNSIYDVHFCSYSATEQRICRIRNKVSNIEVDLDQNLLQYVSFSNSKDQSSGAYIFRSTNATKYPVSSSICTSINNVDGKKGLVQEVEQVFAPFAKQRVRLYNMNDKSLLSLNQFIEIEFEIGELEPDRELITQFSTKLATNGTFFTDDNAFTTMERHRENNTIAFESGSYYPTQYSSYIVDKRSGIQMLIVSDQSRGMTSAEDGQMEYMLHRRTSLDDNRGLERPLNDTSIATITLRIFIDTPSRAGALRRPHSYLHNFPLESFLINTRDPAWLNLDINTLTKYNELFYSNYSAVNFDLPFNLHILSLQANSRDDPSQLLLRLHHIFEQNEHPFYSKPEVIKVDSWLRAMNISKYQETKLSANEPVSKQGTNKLKSIPMTVVLGPSQIRTFLFNRL